MKSRQLELVLSARIKILYYLRGIYIKPKVYKQYCDAAGHTDQIETSEQT